MLSLFEMTERARHSGSRPMPGKVYKQDFEIGPEG
jgi:hypothetical protein